MTKVYSNLMKHITEGKFVFTGELEPVKTTSLHEVIEGAKTLKGHVVAINVTDNPTSFAYMNALIPSYIIQKKVGVEAVYQVTCRDRNRLAITSDLLAAGGVGIKNILALTGDHTTVGDNPQAKNVFDLDSATLVHLIRKMVDEGVDLNENKIDNPPKFHVGIAANPNADPLEPEILKIERKAKLGVDFVQTQCVYNVEVTNRFMKEMSHLDIPVLIGIAPFRSINMMKYFMKFVPGVVVPDEVQQSLIEANEEGGKEGVVQKNIEFFGDFIKELKNTKVAGVHIMAIGFEWIVPKIIEYSGVQQS
ncbi:methylenetetrahydrofolate reductase [Candidatus Bathyarchaeota archaeon]|nr:methylenetetrahydrofolate reductase [Candidatus Bathyarchaeota archaeon]